MSRFNSLLSLLGKAAVELAPSIIPGASTAIKAGQALNDAFKSIKSMNGGTAPADAEAQHDALFKKVMEHADATFDRAEQGDT